MCESFKSLALLLHTNPDEEEEEEEQQQQQERDPFLGGLRHAKNVQIIVFNVRLYCQGHFADEGYTIEIFDPLPMV